MCRHPVRDYEKMDNKKPPLKTLMCIMVDSNRSFLNPDGLWRNLTMIPCKDIDILRGLLEQENFTNVGVVFIHTGVNDIDTVDGEEVAKDLANIVNKLHHLHPHLKIVLSKITPRKIFKDDQVKECNRHLHKSLRDVPSTGVTSGIRRNFGHDIKFSLFCLILIILCKYFSPVEFLTNCRLYFFRIMHYIGRKTKL